MAQITYDNVQRFTLAGAAHRPVRGGSQSWNPRPVSVKRVELNRCHVRFQGSRTWNSAQVFFSRLVLQMQACAVEGGH